MRLWLIRHAEAASGAADASRPLSPEGEGQVAALGRFLRQAHLSPPEEIWHSSLLRARQTAERVTAGAGWKSTALRESPALQPYDDVAIVGRDLLGCTQDLAIVGHQPYLGRLASWLVTGEPEAEVFLIKTGTILALERPAAGPENRAPMQRWSVAWMVTPEILGKR